MTTKANTPGTSHLQLPCALLLLFHVMLVHKVGEMASDKASCMFKQTPVVSIKMARFLAERQLYWCTLISFGTTVRRKMGTRTCWFPDCSAIQGPNPKVLVR